MITAIDLKKVINNLINSNFETRVLANKVKDNFKAPAFFTKVETINYDYQTTLRVFEQYAIEIHYFPEAANDDIDILKTQNKLRQIFDTTLKVKDRYLEIFEIKERTHEGTLFFTFNLRFQQYKKIKDNAKTMNEILFKERDD